MDYALPATRKQRLAWREWHRIRISRERTATTYPPSDPIVVQKCWRCDDHRGQRLESHAALSRLFSKDSSSPSESIEGSGSVDGGSLAGYESANVLSIIFS